MEHRYPQSQTRLRIAGLEFYAYHGARAEERALGGKYAVDAELVYDATQAAQTDDLRSALNYQLVVERIAALVEERPYKLIETVAAAIAERLMDEFPQLQELTVRLRKYSAPLGRAVAYVEVEQTVARAR